jgi:hypothetical protein
MMTLIEVQKIVHDYGEVLGERTSLGVIRDIHSLPYSKSKIKEALKCALRVTSDEPTREHLKIAYISLSDFQELSDTQVSALQSWNRMFVKDPNEKTLAELREEAIVMSNVGKTATAVQSKSTAEAEVLFQELKAAGF